MVNVKIIDVGLEPDCYIVVKEVRKKVRFNYFICYNKLAASPLASSGFAARWVSEFVCSITCSKTLPNRLITTRFVDLSRNLLC